MFSDLEFRDWLETYAPDAIVYTMCEQDTHAKSVLFWHWDKTLCFDSEGRLLGIADPDRVPMVYAHVRAPGGPPACFDVDAFYGFDPVTQRYVR